jgi:cytochrome c553
MKKALKWTGIGLGALVGLLVAAAGVAYLVGSSRLSRTYEVPAVALAVSADSAAVARGAYLAVTSGCQDCHGASLGGQVMADELPFRLVAPNLTALAARYSDADFERAIRHGVGADGRALLIMPSATYHGFADEDVAALIAYIRSVPAVENDLPPMEVRPLGRLIAAGPFDPAMEVNVEPSPATRPPVGPTAAYGAYRYGTLCTYCHGAGGEGMEEPPGPPGMPPVPALAAAARWSLAEFTRALRTGVTPGGRQMDEAMPWTMTARMTDDELAALHAHVTTLGGAQTATAGS